MKRLLPVFAIIAFLLPVNMFAQFDAREPGLYAFVKGECIPLPSTVSHSSSGSSGSLAFSSVNASSTTIYYDGLTSGVISDDTFILVIDPERAVYTSTNPFNKTMSPDDIAIVPLKNDPEKLYRELDASKSIGIANVSMVFEPGSLGFEWEKICDNTFKIKVHGLQPGEYGIALRPYRTQRFEYRLIFGFTVPKGYLEGRVTEMNTSIDRNAPYVYTPQKPSNIPPKDLREGGFNKSLWRLEFGYINRSWVCNYPSAKQREDLFGDGGKFMHGWNFGALITPSFDWGLGLRTGLFVEAYASKSQRITYYCQNFCEFDLYVPLHALYRIPFKKDVALDIFGGAGFQWAFYGGYNNKKGVEWQPGRRPDPGLVSPEKHVYGNGWPERINWQAELGVNFRYEVIGISFSYGFGLVDHHLKNSFDEGKTYETATSSRQDKMQVTVSMFF